MQLIIPLREILITADLPDNIKNRLIPKMTRCTKLTSLFLEKELTASNTELTLKQFIILNKVSTRDRNQTDLALITDRDKGCLTRLIQSMESKKYVERYTKADDKRVNFVKITPMGLSALKTAKPFVLNAFDSITEGLDTDEEQALIQAITKLTNNAHNLLSKAKTDIK